MSSKSMKPSPAKPREMTEEEKQQQILRAYAMKREQIALSAFAGICRADGMKRCPDDAARWAVDAADALMGKLYGKAEQAPENEK